MLALLLCAIAVSFIALIVGLCIEAQRKRRNAETDALIHQGMASAYRRGMLARHSVMGEVWMEERKR